MKINKGRQKLYEKIKIAYGAGFNSEISYIQTLESTATSIISGAPLIDVESSHVKSIGMTLYGKLVIQYHTNWSVYEYDLSPEVSFFYVLNALTTQSVGGEIVWDKLRNGGIPFRRIR